MIKMIKTRVTAFLEKYAQMVAKVLRQLHPLGQSKLRRTTGVAQTCSLTPLIEPVHK